MRFLLRSAFWLLLAFIVIQPSGMDVRTGAQAAADMALEAGRQAATQSLSGLPCASVECVGAKVVMTTALMDRGAQAEPAAQNPGMGQNPSMGQGPGMDIENTIPFPAPRLVRNG